MLASELKTGKIYKEDNAPYQVISYKHIKMARGGATVRVKVKNLLTGFVNDKSYNSTSVVEDADVVNKNSQFLYKSGGYVFMDPQTFEQVNVSEDILGTQARFLKEGQYFQLLYFEGKPVSVGFPNVMEFEVVYTEPGHKGNTVTNVNKDAALENDLKVKVPTFINIGDRVRIDTRTSKYISKA